MTAGLSAALLAGGGLAQAGNHVFSGSETVNFGIVDLATPAGATWATDRSATPGYFSAVAPNGQYINPSDTYNVDGYVKHYASAANQGFVFPVGTGADLRTLSISGPRPASSVIAAAWIAGSPSTTSDPTGPNAGLHPVTSLGPGLEAVSTAGQWDWQDLSGDSAGVTVSVSIPDHSSFGAASVLRLVAWDGTQWIDINHGAPSGNVENSTLSGTAITGMTAIAIARGIDTDGDGIPDIDDDDDDGDGIPDVDEGDGTIDTDGDGIPDSLDLDSDNDGIPDSVELGNAPPSGDTDGDGIPDWRDLDSDNDGINDVREAGGADANGDGMADGPVNEDGIPSSAGPNGITNPPDTDGDGTPDYIDLDSDGDSVPDLWENGGAPLDTNGDGYLSPADSGVSDPDGDGIMTPADGNPAWGDANDPLPLDSDGDGIPDYLDVDSDNDGTTDLEEAGRDPEEVDSDGDGVIDDQTDTDGDGLPDVVDTTPDGPFGGALPLDPADPTDTDGDGIPDVDDPDDDNDGIPDIDEGDGEIDTDGDGIPDSRDWDSDNDGIPDSVELANSINGGDTDGDGIPDWRDLDSDNDGIFDVVEAGHAGVDADRDGRIDTPVGSNGLADIVETSPDSGVINYVPRDTDGDGRPDYLDLDSDNDSIGDLLESGNTGLSDIDSDGQADGTPDANGVIGATGQVTPVDRDGDGLPDYRDVDSNNDGIPDIGDNGFGDLDDNGDGRIDDPADGDGDGIADAIDTETDDFGGLPPAGCAQWSAVNAADNDHDVFPRSQEYAFGGDPETGDHLVVGTGRRQGLVATANASGGVDVSFVRPQGRFDVTYTLQVSYDLQSWVDITGLPEVTPNGDGTDTVGWTNAQTIAPATVARGFARLKVYTPCGGTTFTLVQGWTKETIAGKRQTHGVNFPSAPVFTGRVDSASGSTLSIATSASGSNLAQFLVAPDKYYVELTDGAAEGHRIDLMGGAVDTLVLDLASSNNTTNTLPSGIANSHFVIRKHRTLGEMYPNPQWSGSSAIGTSDQVLLLTGAGYETYWNNSVTGTWIKQGGGFTNQNQTVLAPGHGAFLVQANPNAANAVLQVGEVRYNDFIRPLPLGSTGMNLVALGFPFDASPASLSMTTANGFVGATSAGSSTQILVWNGDTTVNASGYDTNFLFTADGSWRRQSGLVNTTVSPLFRSGRGTFVDVVSAKASWLHAQPWNPAPWTQP